jgi:hypothetical protein
MSTHSASQRKGDSHHRALGVKAERASRIAHTKLLLRINDPRPLRQEELSRTNTVAIEEAEYWLTLFVADRATSVALSS